MSTQFFNVGESRFTRTSYTPPRILPFPFTRHGCSGCTNPQIFRTSPLVPADFEAFRPIDFEVQSYLLQSRLHPQIQISNACPAYITAFRIKSGFPINSITAILKQAQITLDSRIDVPRGINVDPGNLGKRNNCSPLNKQTPFLLISFFRCSINESKHYHF